MSGTPLPPGHGLPLSPSSGRWLLVIEDNPADENLLRELLQSLPGEPYQMVCAPSLGAAMSAIEKAQPEVILLDLDLPDGGGIETVTRLREARPEIPLVVITSENDERVAMTAVQAGAQDYLVKGRVDAWMLARTIRHSLERHRLLTELEGARNRAAHRATHDALTGLPNRALYFDRLNHALQGAERRKERLAVLFIDLDGFKPINDTHGHAAGDEVLVHVAARLGNGVRRSDTVARLGGDEFAVRFERIPDREVAESLVAGLKTLFNEPIEYAGQKFLVSFSAGLAVYPTDGGDADALLKVSDAAMYHQKRAGRSGWEKQQLKVV